MPAACCSSPSIPGAYIHGAARAGLRTAWLNRTGADYPAYFEAPEFTIGALTELPGALTAAG